MRYPDGGGLSPAARERRETLRMQAARLFAEDVAPVQVATRLRVSTKSAYPWRRCWRAGGEAALASTGLGGARCRLSDVQLQRLRTELERGPAEHGWADQRWTLARIATVIARLFHLRYTPRGTAYLLHRLGWSPQVPRHRAAERNEDAIAGSVGTARPDRCCGCGSPPRRPPPWRCAARCRPCERVRRGVCRPTRGCPGTARPRTPGAPGSGTGACPGRPRPGSPTPL